jgi:hypothetical protein
VVTTGTFTIPLMKRTGFPAGQGRRGRGRLHQRPADAARHGRRRVPDGRVPASPYVEVIKHAILPALISYIALVYIVHLEALKADLKGLPKPPAARLAKPLISKLMASSPASSGAIILAGIVYYGLGWIKTVTGDASHLHRRP